MAIEGFREGEEQRLYEACRLLKDILTVEKRDFFEEDGVKKVPFAGEFFTFRGSDKFVLEEIRLIKIGAFSNLIYYLQRWLLEGSRVYLEAFRESHKKCMELLAQEEKRRELPPNSRQNLLHTMYEQCSIDQRSLRQILENMNGVVRLPQSTKALLQAVSHYLDMSRGSKTQAEMEQILASVRDTLSQLDISPPLELEDTGESE